ncbi:phytanoyl-CoA dioxygenase family protein [Burkholderiaceae bacterium DAT-1]|nr:phytanoyl-CoA dioxygenase family protein [Burkholderiaceae bacterium DAT-1]
MTQTIDEISKYSIKQRNLSTISHEVFQFRKSTSKKPLKVLSDADWQHWQDKGYVVIRQAVPEKMVSDLEKLAWNFEEMSPNDPSTWYPEEKSRLRKSELSFNAGMIELYNHQYLWNTRQAQRVYDAFADIWDRHDLWVTIDRMNFNLPPEPGFEFKSFMHWDYDPDAPEEHVQGVLAVNDQTDPAVGGFVCVPDLYRDYDRWRAGQPADWDWYRPDISSFRLEPVCMQAGDLLIFNGRLCHGIRQNVSQDKVRIAQYISMMPARPDDTALREWRIRSWRDRVPPEGYSLHGDPRQWEQTRFTTAELSPLGEKLLGLTDWSQA